jgi:hypothetical protein
VSPIGCAKQPLLPYSELTSQPTLFALQLKINGIGMHDQFSIGAPKLSSSPFGWRVKNLNGIVASVEFESFWQDIDQVETVRISNYSEHHFLGLDSVPLSVRNLCIRLRPNELMVCVQVKSRLAERHNVVPRSPLLPFQH